ncbi:hypothetical protein ARAF_1442 [Arsenophonus endosymbiont of Aleurodicus floccissimus]|nr:hypothetical protein ARAF_1442 [Arsenophonus endosymbiont of Aleurodicus floccissimus]
MPQIVTDDYFFRNIYITELLDFICQLSITNKLSSNSFIIASLRWFICGYPGSTEKGQTGKKIEKSHNQ